MHRVKGGRHPPLVTPSALKVFLRRWRLLVFVELGVLGGDDQADDQSPARVSSVFQPTHGGESIDPLAARVFIAQTKTQGRIHRLILRAKGAAGDGGSWGPCGPGVCQAI